MNGGGAAVDVLGARGGGALLAGFKGLEEERDEVAGFGGAARGGGGGGEVLELVDHVGAAGELKDLVARKRVENQAGAADLLEGLGDTIRGVGDAVGLAGL